jgi:asparagine synthase (glutamine-hydrolysing)
VRQAVAAGRVVLTGIGGDELMSLLPQEQSSQAIAAQAPAPSWLTTRGRQLAREAAGGCGHPSTVVPETALLAAGCRAPTFLRHGVWPVNPLCTPELVRFCQWLPTHWRTRRRLQRERLARAGLDQTWLHPPRRENFAHVMRHALARYGVPMLEGFLPDLALADLGLVEPAAVRQALERNGPAMNLLYEVVNLELALRHLLR